MNPLPCLVLLHDALTSLLSESGTSGSYALRQLYQKVDQTIQQQQRDTGVVGGQGETHEGSHLEGPQGNCGPGTWQCRHRACIIVDDAWFLEAAAAGATTGGALDFLHYCRTLGCGKHVSLFCCNRKSVRGSVHQEASLFYLAQMHLPRLTLHHDAPRTL